MIPKIIHYCWLSDDPIPQQYQEYIDGWRRLMPDYTIKKWDRKAFDLDQHPFAKQAFESKKYAFAADYIRVYALYTEGGIYLDSDVKVLKPFDGFLGFDYFTSFENHWDGKDFNLLYLHYIDREGNRKEGTEKVINVGLQAAVLGCKPQHPYIAKLWEYYQKQSWEKDGHLFCEQKKHTAPTIHARHCESFGFKYADRLQLLDNGIAIFPSDVFCTQGIHQTSNTHAVHMCANSWGG